MIVIDREADTATMTRVEDEALVEAAEDVAHLAAEDERERRPGVEVARREHLPGALVERMLDGEHPLRLWRE